MIKWFLYIVILLAFTPCLLSAKAKYSRNSEALLWQQHTMAANAVKGSAPADTTKKAQAKPGDPKVKEVPKSKKQAKPEKLGDPDDKTNTKPKRERRPDGMQRPPEIPRRIDN